MAATSPSSSSQPSPRPGSPITRFAPSPTGHLHIGGARTALFCWAFAQRNSGHFLLRIEDTDQARSSESSARGILEDLAWLGIHWDEGPELPRQGGQGGGTRGGGGGGSGGDPRGVGPFYQAQRLNLYNQYIDWLIAHDLAYPAFETPEQLDAARKAAVAEKTTYRYDRQAMQLEQDQRMKLLEEGAPHVVRFKAPDEPVIVHDEVLGEVSFAAGELDDFVIRKADGFPTYHFAVVIDDELMGVTHVLRGQEHLNNTPRHVALQKALKHPDGTPFRIPVFAHMPLIFNMDGSKMSKRDKDKAVREACRKAGVQSLAAPELRSAVPSSVSEEMFQQWLADKQRQLPAEALEPLAAALKIDLPEIEVEDFRRAGYLPEVICNFIALLGWSPGGDREKFDMQFLRDNFDLKRIGKTNSKFDRVKLASFNGDALAAMDAQEFLRRWMEWMTQYAPQELRWLRPRGPDSMLHLAAAVKPRARTFRDAVRASGFAIAGDDEYPFDPAAVQKALLKGTPQGVDTLAAFRAELEGVTPWSPQAIDAAVSGYAQRAGLGVGQVAQPVRVAVTGGLVSPGIGETLAVLGRESTLRRIDRCIDTVRQHAPGHAA